LNFAKKCATLGLLESYFMRIFAVTTLRNEAPFVVEWVEHMRAIGGQRRSAQSCTELTAREQSD
jgi:hypothetical protein